LRRKLSSKRQQGGADCRLAPSRTAPCSLYGAAGSQQGEAEQRQVSRRWLGDGRELGAKSQVGAGLKVTPRLVIETLHGESEKVAIGLPAREHVGVRAADDADVCRSNERSRDADRGQKGETPKISTLPRPTQLGVVSQETVTAAAPRVEKGKSSTAESKGRSFIYQRRVW
jgi:hypothetical protein